MRTARSIAIAIAAGVIASLASPPAGVWVHWDPSSGATDNWVVSPPAYGAVSTLLAVTTAGLISWVSSDRRILPSECTVGIGLIVFAGVQRVAHVSVLLALAFAITVALASFTVFTASESHE